MLVMLLRLLHHSIVSGFDTSPDSVTESNVVLCSMVFKFIVRSTKQCLASNYSLVWVLSFDSFLLMMIAFTFSSHPRLHVMLVRSN